MDKQDQLKHPGVIWLTKNGFDFCITGQAQVLHHEFDQSVMSYSEILDSAKLDTDIQTFIQQNNVPASILILVFGPDAMFEQDIPANPPDQLKLQQEQFLDIVPYDQVFSKTWVRADKVHIAACNADLHTMLKNSFEKTGSKITLAIPYFVTEKNAMDAELPILLWKKFDSLKHEGLLESEEPTYSHEEEKKTSPVPGHSNRELMLVGFFGLLLFVFVIFIYFTFFIGK